MRIGFGTDIHRLVDGKPLIIGNIIIEHNKGCDGHSDGDPLIHAICDSLLGALALRDIGFHFPDTSVINKDRNSSFFLVEVMKMIRNEGYEILNIDSVVNLQKPKLSSYIPSIIDRLSSLMDIDSSKISVKAKTSENLGFIGNEEGVSVEAIALLQKNK
jgi:2-C-methyl-D-erythritol 2,4-cyclodiphosphate synthase